MIQLIKFFSWDLGIQGDIPMHFFLSWDLRGDVWVDLQDKGVSAYKVFLAGFWECKGISLCISFCLGISRFFNILDNDSSFLNFLGFRF